MDFCSLYGTNNNFHSVSFKRIQMQILQKIPNSLRTTNLIVFRLVGWFTGIPILTIYVVVRHANQMFNGKNALLVCDISDFTVS